jgi:hypothetical protein
VVECEEEEAGALALASEGMSTASEAEEEEGEEEEDVRVGVPVEAEAEEDCSDSHLSLSPVSATSMSARSPYRAAARAEVCSALTAERSMAQSIVVDVEDIFYFLENEQITGL